MNMYDLFGRPAKRNLLLPEKNMAVQLRFPKLHLNKLQDETKVEMFAHNVQHHIWRKPNTGHQHNT